MALLSDANYYSITVAGGHRWARSQHSGPDDLMCKLYVVTNHCVILYVCIHMACITQHPLLLGMVM